MRVLHLINSLSGSGGAEQGLVREVRAMEGHIDQLVARLYQPNALEASLEQDGVPTQLIGVSPGNSGWNWPAAARRFTDLAREFAPDLIQTSLASSNLVGQIAGSRIGVPVLSTFTLSGDPTLMHSYQPGAASLPARAMRRVESYWGRKRHVWFRALTRDALETNCQAGGYDPERASVIPRGVPLPERSQDIGKAGLGLPDKPIVLNVGRQTAQKGHVDLVAIFARARQEIDAHLVILGREGDGSAPLRAAIDEHGLDGEVTVVPYTPTPYAYYLASDVFAFPSFMEGLGTAVLEAMACGLPVAAYDIPPVREIDGGRDLLSLVEVGDRQSLSQRVVDVLAHPDGAAGTAKKAREVIEEEYSVATVANKLLARMSRVVSEWAEVG